MSVVVLLARRRGEQLRVGQAVEPLGVARPQDARGDDQRARARPPAGLVDAGDGPEPVAVQGRSAASRSPTSGGRRRATDATRAAAARGGRIVRSSPWRVSGAARAPRRGHAESSPAPPPQYRTAASSARVATEAAPTRSRRPCPPHSACGSTEAILPNRSNGITIIRARPITLEIGTAPWPGTRESAELFRLSPIIHSSPAGTVTGPNGVLPGRPGVRQVVDVGLVERLAVDQHAVAGVAACDGLAADGDDPLDEVLLVRRREPDQRPEPLQAAHQRVRRLLDGELAAPAVGSAEDDDVPGLRVAEPVGDLVDEHAVVHAARAAVQRGLHRPRRDDVDLGQERLDEEGQHQRDHDEDRQLPPERRPAAPARLLRPAARRRRRVARGRALRRRRAELTPPPRVARRAVRCRSPTAADPRSSGSPPSARRRPAGATPWRGAAGRRGPARRAAERDGPANGAPPSGPPDRTGEAVPAGRRGARVAPRDEATSTSATAVRTRRSSPASP